MFIFVIITYYGMKSLIFSKEEGAANDKIQF